MTTCSAVLCDLFDTLVHFNYERLPRVHWLGRTLPSTAPVLLPLLTPQRPELTAEEILGAMIQASTTLKTRGPLHREFPSSERMGVMLEVLGLPRDMNLEVALGRAHTSLLCEVVHFPPEYRGLLVDLRRRGPVVLVSNFDHAESCRRMLSRLEMDGLFDDVVISEEVGWRKPHPDIFTRALAGAGVEPSRALFVGDNLDADVWGAHHAGIPAVWINAKGRSLPSDLPGGTQVIQTFNQLRDIIGRY